MKLKGKIMLLVGGAFLLCVSTFTLLTYLQTGRLLRTQIEERQLDLAVKTAETIDQWFLARTQLIAAAATAAAKGNPEQPEQILEQFKVAASGGQFMSVYAGYSAGQFFDSSGWMPPADYDHRVRPWYTEAVAAGRAIQTKPYTDANSGETIISIAAPILQGGTAVGVVSADIALTYIVETVLNTKVTGNGYAVVTHKDGTILIHPKKEIIGKSLPSLHETLAMVYKQMLQSNTGIFEYVLKDAGKVLSYAVIPSTDWYLQVTAEKSALYAPLRTLLYEMLGLGLLYVAVGLGIAYWLARGIALPLGRTMNMIQELEKGHLDVRLNMAGKDEIGLMAKTMDAFADSLQHDVVANLQKLAAGKLDYQVTPRDGQDEIRGALQKLGADLNEIVQQILLAGEQIASGSGQVADGSQSLSQGATEQASSLEEISASLAEMASQTGLSAENANQANLLSSQAQNAAQKGSVQMQEMVAAMTEINESGRNISKIIKTIDEIAFQTNLLALNAAVEAARAGAHGKGFAVVAEEVRNLAARSARAAAETAALIQGSVDKTANGSAIAQRTAESLQEIVGGITQVSDLVGEIAAASNEQAQGISQVNLALNQIGAVTQQNTASAEESAAAAEELSGQSEQLRQMLQRFTLKNQQPRADHAPAQRKRQESGAGWKTLERPKTAGRDARPQIALDDDEFGRY